MKVSIIGSGISGLSLGCYLQMNGYETAIYEKHSQPGGLCASWKKSEYTFDGCLHWILGSGKESSFYKLWSQLLDMESIEFISHEVSVAIELNNNCNKYGDNVFRLYTNIDRLKAYLIDLAPEDKRMIQGMVRLMRVMQKYELPPMIDNIPQLQTLRQKMAMITYLPFIFQYLKWKKVTNYSFARKLKNPFLKEAFELLFDGDDINLLAMTMPLAFYDKKSAGYPVGGSAKFAGRIADKYESLGGKIHCSKGIKKIIVEDNIAKGILLNDDTPVYSDITISTADWHFTVFDALEGKYVNDKILELVALKKLQVYPSIMLVSLGVARSFKEQPHFFRFPMKNEYRSPDGTVYKRIEAHIYHYDPTLAPEGKTIIVMSFYSRNGEFWINLRNNDRAEYNRCKSDFAAAMIHILDEKIGGVKESIEETDVATPATYQRYTGNWKGSAQGWFPAKNPVAASPITIDLPGLKNFYYTSHWSTPGGGLPTVLKSSHDLAQKLCLKHKTKFMIR
ncbi:MAG: NAD(P)/FAD-dependent oxidoreductase [Bacteroidales bacterium]|jgi:phytoene dehydrogenase-like protein